MQKFRAARTKIKKILLNIHLKLAGLARPGERAFVVRVSCGHICRGLFVFLNLGLVFVRGVGNAAFGL